MRGITLLLYWPRQSQLREVLSQLLLLLCLLGTFLSDFLLVRLTWPAKHSPNLGWESTHRLHLYPLGGVFYPHPTPHPPPPPPTSTPTPTPHLPPPPPPPTSTPTPTYLHLPPPPPTSTPTPTPKYRALGRRDLDFHKQPKRYYVIVLMNWNFIKVLQTIWGSRTSSVNVLDIDIKRFGDHHSLLLIFEHHTTCFLQSHVEHWLHRYLWCNYFFNIYQACVNRSSQTARNEYLMLGASSCLFLSAFHCQRDCVAVVTTC